MQSGHYDIVTDPARKFVRLKLFGFWTEETAKAFVADQQAAVRRVCWRSGEHLVLTDLTDFNLQSQVVVRICQDLIAHSPLSAKRLAIVAGDGLARIQIKRIMVRDGMQVFATPDEAEAWLFAPDEQARATG